MSNASGLLVTSVILKFTETERQQSDDDHNIVRNNYGKECEERYFATMGDDKIIQFICKICNKSSTSQKSIKQHVSWKHGSEDSEGFCPTT